MIVRAVLRLMALLAIAVGSTALPASAAAPRPDASPASAPGPPPPSRLADNPNPPAEPVKLIFIHHSTGANWLADWDGGLGIALRDNNYFVSDTDYGWGPDGIGDYTDIGHWWTWFRGSKSATYLSALYTESDRTWDFYSRLPTDPGGENEVIIFKSCFPNSHLAGKPDDEPTIGHNPLRGQPAFLDSEPNPNHTVANVKGIYNDLLSYFATRQDRLFVVIAAPPLGQNDTDATHAANARAFNNWLVEDWLDGYAHSNVAVFDFYNVLTSNGGNPDTNDLNSPTGNHHRWRSGAVQYIQTVGNDYAAYGLGEWDSHPTTAGNEKATAEFVQLLNVFYHRWAEGDVPPVLDHWIYLPAILRNWATPSPGPGQLIQPEDLVYRGAFRLPERAVGADDEETWEWGGQAFAYRSGGDPAGGADGYPGSLLGTGHAHHNYVSEIGIPQPSLSRNLAQLNRAGTLQPFCDVRAGLFDGLAEIPRVGLEYLPALGRQTSDKLYLAWGQHFQEDASTVIPSHAWCDLDLSRPDTKGAWWIGDESLYSTNGYVFAIPQQWASEHAGGMMLATGRYRDGGWSGMGPSLFAYGPWLDGNPPAPGAHLNRRTLLLYSNTRGEDQTDFKVNGYHHSDEWEGGAWLVTPDGRVAVVFAGTKGSGYCWYGWASPGGDGMPCVEGGVDGFITCYTPDWIECPPELSRHCEEGSTHSYRGWWSSRFDAQILFYDPADFARVAGGSMSPHEPQPYATLDIDEHLFLGPSPEPMMTGSGDQRRYRIGEAAYDRERVFLYVPEFFADDATPVIHVWSVQ